jgi:hypothetical protein
VYPFVEIGNCSLSGHFNSNDADSNYGHSIKCLDFIFDNYTIKVSKILNGVNDYSKKFLYTRTSDLLWYKNQSFTYKYDTFKPTSGNFEFEIKLYELGFGQKITYTRQLDAETGKLNSGNYQYITNFGDSAIKNCQLNIESKSNYYNTLNCALSSKMMPIDLNYGWALKVTKPADYILGKRDVELQLNLPFRKMKFDYKANYDKVLNDDLTKINENTPHNFEGSLKFYYDLQNDINSYLLLNLKREHNQEEGKSSFTATLLNHPDFNSIEYKFNRIRDYNQTTLQSVLSYQLAKLDKKSNQLTLTLIMSSDMNENTFSTQFNLERPSIDLVYDNKFNKHTGEMNYINIQIAKVLKLTVDKGVDNDDRKISIEFNNPSSNEYKLEATSTVDDSLYKVVGKLSKNAQSISQLTSSFDSNKNQLNATIQSLNPDNQNKYELSTSLLDEKTFKAVVVNNQKKVIDATLSIVKDENKNFYYEISYPKLKLNLNWSRFWSQLKKEILDSRDVYENDKFNSYFGDAYSQLKSELTQPCVNSKDGLSNIGQDFATLIFIEAASYEKYLSPFPIFNRRYSQVKYGIQNSFIEVDEDDDEDDDDDEEDDYSNGSILSRYNQFANRFNNMESNSPVYYYLYNSNTVPRLPIIYYEYNSFSGQLDNSLTVSLEKFNTDNLYQLNSQYRDFLRQLADKVLTIKSAMIKSKNLMAMRNEYTLSADFKLVGHIHNRRNIIQFNGNFNALQTRCQYLLAHDIHRNKFSIILNNDKDKSTPQIFFHTIGKKFAFSSNKVEVDDESIALPAFYTSTNGQDKVSIRRSVNSICVDLNDDAKVCCYDDSNSCTVTLNRFYTGRVNGLLGKGNEIDESEESKWFLGDKCEYRNLPLKNPSIEASKICYQLFGQHLSSPFRSSFRTVSAKGWQEFCQSSLTVKPQLKCDLIKGFVHYANLFNVKQTIPDECCKFLLI